MAGVQLYPSLPSFLEVCSNDLQTFSTCFVTSTPWQCLQSLYRAFSVERSLRNFFVESTQPALENLRLVCSRMDCPAAWRGLRNAGASLLYGRYGYMRRTHGDSSAVPADTSARAVRSSEQWDKAIACWWKNGEFLFPSVRDRREYNASYVFLQLASQDRSLNQLATHKLIWELISLCVSMAGSLPYVFGMIGLTLRELPPGLFVYGTLHPDRAPEEVRQQAQQLVWRGSGSVAGQLRDLGEYFALLPGDVGHDVEGDVFSLPDDHGSLLAAFDRYEGYDPQAPESSLFLRQKRTVTLPDGHTEQHWVYVYNRDLPAPE